MGILDELLLLDRWFLDFRLLLLDRRLKLRLRRGRLNVDVLQALDYPFAAAAAAASTTSAARGSGSACALHLVRHRIGHQCRRDEQQEEEAVE